MARTESWIRVKIKNRRTGKAIFLYHPPKAGAAGEDVDRDLRAILEIPSPQPAGYKPRMTIEALPSPADWLSALVSSSVCPPEK
jgi:hypothetical protein